MKRNVVAKMAVLLVALFLGAGNAYAFGGLGGDGGDGGQGGYSKAYGGDGGSAKAYGGDGGTGIGVGVGKGGNARQSQGLIGIQGQNTKVRTSTKAYGGSSYQHQGQRTRVGTQDIVEIQGDSVLYEAPKKPDVMAYTPDVNLSPATAPCYIPWGGSGGSGTALVTVSAAGAVKDHGCAFGEVARRAHDIGNRAVAEEALAHMLAIVKKEAGVDDDVTDGTVTVVATTEPVADPAGHGDYASFMGGND